MSDTYCAYEITESIAQEVSRRFEKYNDGITVLDVEPTTDGVWEIHYEEVAPPHPPDPLEPTVCESQRARVQVKQLLEQSSVGEDIVAEY